jgi:hypothetical protein
MSGHREQSFDPNGGVDNRPPMRPFTGTQWIGLGLLLLGGMAIVIYLLGRIGAIPKIVDDEIPFVSVMPLGAVLMDPRRRSGVCDPEALRRRRIAIVVLALAAAVLGAVLAILLAKGA